MLHATRRTFISGAAALSVLPSAALAYPAGLAFAAIRNGKKIGEHRLTFEGSGEDLTVRVRAEMAVKIGPVTVFRYAHDVVERWRGGRFERLESKTSSNGARESVVAQRSAGGVMIRTGAKQALGPANTLPFTHWNPLVANAPLFNPQTGKLLKLTVREVGRSPLPGGGAEARRVAFRGDAEIDNWYDAEGTWIALRGRLDDGSTMEYRRI
jgi:hypothetical protein